jgi:hypothetical protein
MNSFYLLPKDIFQVFVSFLSLWDLVQFDSAWSTKLNREVVFELYKGCTIEGDEHQTLSGAALLWFTKRSLLLKIVSLNQSVTNSDLLINGVDWATKLRYFNISVNRNISGTSLTLVLEKAKHLQTLLLSDVQCVTDSLLISAANNLELREVNLSHNLHISDHGVALLTKSTKFLQSLTLDGCERIGNSLVISLATHCPSLLHLNLRMCSRVMDGSLVKLAHNCAQLRSLNLYRCHGVTDAAIVALSESCKELQCLNVSLCRNITDFGIRAIESSCHNLQSLNLTDCWRITDASIMDLTHCTKLHYLNLTNCRAISDSSLVVVASACTDLRVLHLTSCVNITSETVVAIGSFLKQLKVLSLCNCRQVMGRFLVEMSQKLVNLSKLNISNCNVSDNEVIEIIQLCSSLREFYLHTCNLSRDTVLRGLVCNPRLRINF